MLAMKQLSSTKLWMANPGLHPEGVINFSHCTAPLNMFGTGKCPYILRNHYESGIGTSLQFEYPAGQVVTTCRISDEVSKMTVHRGITIEGEYECACRTQAYVKFDDFKHYLNTVLGWHQIFSFEDICDNMKLLGAQLGWRLYNVFIRYNASTSASQSAEPPKTFGPVAPCGSEYCSQWRYTDIKSPFAYCLGKYSWINASI